MGCYVWKHSQRSWTKGSENERVDLNFSHWLIQTEGHFPTDDRDSEFWTIFLQPLRWFLEQNARRSCEYVVRDSTRRHFRAEHESSYERRLNSFKKDGWGEYVCESVIRIMIEMVTKDHSRSIVFCEEKDMTSLGAKITFHCSWHQVPDLGNVR